MRLTWSRTELSPSQDDAFPTTQLFILALCRLAEPIALTSIFPYSWPMVKSFHVGNVGDASFYAGILIASFSLAESITSMWWGGLSDRIGRKPVLLMGCCGTILSLLIVGFSTSFTVALIGRVLGGILNGNIGIIQTMVAELVTNPAHEPKAYAIMPFVWSVGTIIGPAIGGVLANPTTSFPNFFLKTGLFARFPWLLPNIVCAGFMLLSVIAGYFCLKETHPAFYSGAQPHSSNPHRFADQTPMIRAAGTSAEQNIDLRRGSYGTFNEVEVPENIRWLVNADGTPHLPSVFEEKSDNVWLTRNIITLTIALGLFTYHSMCYDHLLPIFFQDDRGVSTTASGPFHIPGGLGMTTKTVGAILSVNGLIALFVQAVIFPLLTQHLGVWQVFILVTVLHPIAYFVVPYLALLPQSLLFPGIYACLTIRNVFAILEYPVILILLKQASPSASLLGRINGLAAAAGAACRTVAPPVAGLLYGWGAKLSFTGLAWWGAGAVAIISALQIWTIPREKDDSTRVRSLAPCLRRRERSPVRDHVYVQIQQTDDG